MPAMNGEFIHGQAARVIPMEMFVQSPQPGLVDLFHCIPGKIRFLSSVSHRFFKRSVLNVLA